MKSSFIYLIFLASFASGHSWLECTDHDNTQILEWMKGNASLSPPKVVDSSDPNLLYFCHGYPRNKAYPGNWIDESEHYIWNLGANAWNNGHAEGADTNACPAEQRSPTYQANAPMATAAPGSLIRLRFGGNGHSRGFNVGGDPGTVSVYWKGAPEQEITDVSEFTQDNLLASGGFAGDAFIIPADPTVTTPADGLSDFGNWLPVQLPTDMQSGRHMMVWVWSYKNQSQWSTCFDVMVQGDAINPQSDLNPASNTDPSPAAPENGVSTTDRDPAATSAPAPVAATSPDPAPAPAPAVVPDQVPDASPVEACQIQPVVKVVKVVRRIATPFSA